MVIITRSENKKEAAERFNVPYFETSAKEGINVEEIFVHIARSLIDNSGFAFPLPFIL